MRDIRRIAIVNRGEPAMRLIHAAREYQREQGVSIATIALYTDPDARSMFVREADHAFSLGPALVPAADGSGRKQSAYLDYHKLEEALVLTGADAAWVGWGFVAEHAAFAELCRRLRVQFIGPTPEAMRRLGDKITAKRLAEQAGVPVAPWSGGPVDTIEALREQAARLGYPIMIKATTGGGGRGIRQVSREEDLPGAFESARRESAAIFGDPTVFVEQRLRGARHIEVQILGDEHGTVWAVGVRDCTLQRRHQKLVEEAPSPALLPEEEHTLREAACRLAHRAGYHGAGTVEFLFDPESRRTSFMEVNARLQVEHAVTECTTGVDLVKLQLHVARGGALEGDPPPTLGHSIEVRLCAEDPDRHFAPAPGVVELLRIAGGPGVRVDTGVAEGDRVAPEFDSMIAKIIATGADRREALSRLHRALAGSAVVIRGGASNRAFLLSLLERAEVQQGAIDTTWLDGVASQQPTGLRPLADVALLQAAIAEHDQALRAEIDTFLASANRGRPASPHEPPRPCELIYGDARYRFEVRRIGPHDYRITPEGGTGIDVSVEELGRFERRLRCFGRVHRATAISHGGDHLVEVDGVPHHIGRDPGGVLEAPIPAVVVSFHCKVGDRVKPGDALVVLEAMKMEVPVNAPLGGVVRAIHVQPNTQVPVGTVLLEIEPEGLPVARPDSERVRFDPQAPPSGGATARERFHAACEELRRLLLGFDVTPGEARSLAARWAEICRTSRSDAATRRAEDQLLALFTDVHGLFRRQRPGERDDADAPRSASEYLTHYLRVRDVRAAGLPASFAARLERALGWYGASTSVPGLRLEESLLRIHRSHDRIAEQVAPVTSILERRLAEPNGTAVSADDATLHPGGESLRRLLDRLVAVSSVPFPSLADLAAEVRHALFTRPLFERVSAEDFRRLDEGITALREGAGHAGDPNGSEGRAALVERLVDCPQPLAGPLSRRAARADREETAILLELLTRRFYRIRALERFGVFEAGGQLYATGEYTHEGRHKRIFSAFSSFSGLGPALDHLASAASDVPATTDLVADFYVFDGSPSPDLDATASLIQKMLERAPLERRMRRISVTLAATEVAWGLAREQNFTFRPVGDGDGGEGYREERPLRGIHPMMAKRLHIWQLDRFNLERLPSVQDIYLYRGLAIGNPKDERLFAVAEVRDVTPVRDAGGHVVELPHLERMLVEACAAIRLAQARRASSDRLEWNRVLLYVWPPLVLTSAELSSLARRMAPGTEGLGLEMVLVRARLATEGDPGRLRDTLMLLRPGPGGVQISLEEPTETPLLPLSEYQQKVAQLRRRGLAYPYELVRMMTPETGDGGFPRGEFIEHDLDERGRLVPVSRPPGGNTAHIVCGLIRSFTERYPEGMTRVILLGDPAREMGSLAQAECHRVCAAIDLAEELHVPLEWFALSAGAKISMKSGTENMDWVARALRRIITFTQGGGEINVVVCGINVGAQPYWNAEATMLMHTRGILVMTPEGAMVLTGKQALDYSGSVSADDNTGIGGYERIMGVNGQAQYFARDIPDAARLLLRHYEHTYLAPGERWPRPFATTDPRDRDPRSAPHPECGFTTVGEIFDDHHNPDRKRPFEIRRVMAAVADQDHATLERWTDWRGAEMTVVWDAFLGGHAVGLIGVGSRPVERLGFVPADGPERWTAGTFFPQSSKKMARAINAISGNRPLVVLANLSGFDGSPESMRKWQLEYGAEIGRAVVNFKGPIVFCVVSRYHGGAFVVFSRALNEHFEAAALEGSHASVIGGAPAAAVVFAREVDTRTAADPRVHELEEQLRAAAPADKPRIRAELQAVSAATRAVQLGKVAEEFDTIHDIHRALRVGSLDRVIAARDLRAYLIDAVERGVRRCATT